MNRTGEEFAICDISHRVEDFAYTARREFARPRRVEFLGRYNLDTLRDITGDDGHRVPFLGRGDTVVWPLAFTLQTEDGNTRVTEGLFEASEVRMDEDRVSTCTLSVWVDERATDFPSLSAIVGYLRHLAKGGTVQSR